MEVSDTGRRKIETDMNTDELSEEGKCEKKTERKE